MPEPAAIDDDLEYSPADLAALEACIAQYKAESEGCRLQIEGMLADGEWEHAALLAAYGCQWRNLHLAVCDFPPCWVEPDDPDSSDDHCGQASARQLLRKMLAAGLSRYDPDPLKSLAAARKRKKKTAL